MTCPVQAPKTEATLPGEGSEPSGTSGQAAKAPEGGGSTGPSMFTTFSLCSWRYGTLTFPRDLLSPAEPCAHPPVFRMAY